MVTMPDGSRFFVANDEQANCIYTEFANGYENNRLNSIASKKLLFDTYHKIDDFFENDIRSQHAESSAMEIRTFPELNFIDPAMRELIARVSNGHGYDTTDIYYVKSTGTTSLLNEKLITILLRLSDLLDMSRYRISKVILNHNLENLTPTSRFHWISHLLTDGYTLHTEYKFANPEKDDKNIGELLSRGSITEQVMLTVNVLISQTTEVLKTDRCKFTGKSEFISENGGQPEILIECNQDGICDNKKCNFMCKWFIEKKLFVP